MVKHYCDKCKNEFGDSELTEVKLIVGYVSMFARNGDYAKIEICNECLKALGIEINGCGTAKIPEKNDTEKLYEIIQNIVSECTSNQ